MTYEEQAALSVDIPFRNRIKIALMHFGDYIAGEPTTTAAHNTRLKFANDVFRAPDQTAAQYQHNVVQDAKVQEDGAAITDADLQSSVEATVNKLM